MSYQDSSCQTLWNFFWIC